MLPNFLVIGSQKAGTTSLYNILKEHPQVFMAEKKEVNFFFLDSEFRKGIEHYQKFFSDISPGKIACGEASPGYICHPLAPARIKEYLPNVKLILTVRNPIERAYSQYWDNRMTLSEPHEFAQTLDFALNDTYEPGKPGYFSRGTYMQYIQRYLKLFSPDQLLVLLFDDLRQDPSKFYRMCFEFLGVDSDFRPPDMDRAFNPSSVWDNLIYTWFFERPPAQRFLPPRLKRLVFWGRQKRFRYPPMDETTRQRLVEFYTPWNQELAAFLKRDLSAWSE
jgi:hypothetical protein